MAACKHLVIYMAGGASRGVMALFADWQQTGLLLLVRPRGSALNEQAKQAAQAHPLAAQLALTVEAVDSWEAACVARTIHQPAGTLHQPAASHHTLSGCTGRHLGRAPLGPCAS